VWVTSDKLRLALVADAAVDEVVRDSARELCFGAFDGGFSSDDWDHSCGGVRVLLTEADELVAHVAVVARRLDVGGQPLRTGYVEAMAVRSDRQGEGFGRQAMGLATSHIRTTYEFGALSTGRHAFYERLGWERWQGPSFVRSGERLTRTAGEDEGLMVLRCGPSAGLALSSSISCESRRGDDW
jgi:aminoglycoside 2'-N-acetyltransferase I